MSPSRVLLFLAVITPLTVVAAPVPESVTHQKAFKRTFGTSHTPIEGSSFRFDGQTLTAKFPKVWAGSCESWVYCLRTERKATGDFDLTVMVRTSASATPPTELFGKWARLGGGLAVWEPDAKDPTIAAKDETKREKKVNMCRYYALTGKPPKGDPFAWESGDYSDSPGLCFHRDDDTDDIDDIDDPTETIHLRITRRGNLFTTAKSADGENWKILLDGRPIEMPATISVGVWAFEDTHRQFEVTFEKFSLTQK